MRLIFHWKLHKGQKKSKATEIQISDSVKTTPFTLCLTQRNYKMKITTLCGSLTRVGTRYEVTGH